MLVRVSVKLAPVSWVAFGLVSVKVIVEVPPEIIGLVPNALVIIGLVRITVESASDGLLLAPPPVTSAVFISGVDALAATETVRVMGSNELPIAKGSERVQVNVPSTQFQFAPLMAVAVRPVGSVSVTVTVPEVEAPPTLLTRME
jgi:hypothetical protein